MFKPIERGNCTPVYDNHIYVDLLHRVRRMSNSDWSSNSFTMAVFENIFLAPSEFIIQKIDFKKCPH